MANDWLDHIKISCSGGAGYDAVVVNEACFFGGFLIGADKVNDPEITVYDNNAAGSGAEIVPTNTYDADVLGLNGVVGPSKTVLAKNGLWIVITCDGACEVTVYYKKLSI